MQTPDSTCRQQRESNPRRRAISSQAHVLQLSQRISSLSHGGRSCTVFESQKVICRKLQISARAFSAPTVGDQFKFHHYRWQHKTRVPRLPYSIVCEIVCFAILRELRFVTDRQTDGQRTIAYIALAFLHGENNTINTGWNKTI